MALWRILNFDLSIFWLFYSKHELFHVKGNNFKNVLAHSYVPIESTWSLLDEKKGLSSILKSYIFRSLNLGLVLSFYISYSEIQILTKLKSWESFIEFMLLIFFLKLTRTDCGCRRYFLGKRKWFLEYSLKGIQEDRKTFKGLKLCLLK